MGRGRGKGKKLAEEEEEADSGSGEEEKIPAPKRRGRPQKALKDDLSQEEGEQLGEDGGEVVKNNVPIKETGNPILTENGSKRKRSSQVKEKQEPTKKEDDVANQSHSDDLKKRNGFRHIGSRRKSKPRRAAEAVVE